MKSKLLEHLASVIFVTAALLFLLALLNHITEKGSEAPADSGPFGDLSFVDFADPFQAELIRDLAGIYRPGRASENDSILKAVGRMQRSAQAMRLHEAGNRESLTAARLADLALMYGKFLLVYLIVMALVWYGVETLAVWRYAVTRHRRRIKARTSAERWKRAFAAAASGIASFILFCPAYVIAYSIRTEFNTDTAVFLVILAVLSNGLLITYANKFYSLLLAESRKGYVDTAIVKGLHEGFRLNSPDGIRVRDLLHPRKRFSGHVFDHLFRNARYHYLGTLKEQASFLITGLIIIEMALNIHGHLSYELLRQLLYRNFEIVTAIVLGIFYTVKLTEAATDFFMHRQRLRYENG